MTNRPALQSDSRAERVLRHPLAKLGRATFAAGFVLAWSASSIAAPPADSTAPIDAQFHAAYPMTAPVSPIPLAGVELAKLTIAGLRLHARQDRTVDDQGIELCFVDSNDDVRVVVRVAVSPDAKAARRFVEIELHGISTSIPAARDTNLGDVAFADDHGSGTSLVVASLANIAYTARVLDGSSGAPRVPTAAAIATQLRALMVVGAPVFPAAEVVLPTIIDAKKGAQIRVVVPAGNAYKLTADGAYVARGNGGPVVRPFAAGAVTVHATVVDELGRVTVASKSAVAK
ncbi:MAG: hypothetical protein NVS3B20_12810 [Polyangiales bacterium]